MRNPGKGWFSLGATLFAAFIGLTACAPLEGAEPPRIGLDSSLPAGAYTWSAPSSPGWEANESGYRNEELGCLVTPTVLPGDDESEDTANTQALADNVFAGGPTVKEWLPLEEDRQIEFITGPAGTENSQAAVRVTEFATLVVVVSCDTAEQFEEVEGTVSSVLARSGITLQSTLSNGN